jgi:hypothetical protein
MATVYSPGGLLKSHDWKNSSASDQVVTWQEAHSRPVRMPQGITLLTPRLCEEGRVGMRFTQMLA